MTRRRLLGCVLPAAIAALVLVLAWPTLWALFVFFAGQGTHVYHETRSPAGREARLERPGGGMEPILYWVKLDGGQCTLARIVGYSAEDWVRLSWIGTNMIEIRYGLPPDDEAKARAPELVTGDGACLGVTARIVADPALVPPPGLGGSVTYSDQARNGS